MIDQNIKLLIDKLIHKTKIDQAIWQKTSRDTEFKLFFENGGAITTDKYHNSYNSKNEIDFTILNDRGESINRFSYNELEEKDFKTIETLYQIIYDKYYKVNSTLDSILTELEGDEIIGRRKIDLPL